MKKYVFKAKDKNGNTLRGIVEAPTPEQGAKLVREKGLLVIDVKVSRDNLFSLIRRLSLKVTPGDLVNFTRQFSTMIGAGLPITESLSILRMQSKPALKSVVGQLLADIEGGQSLSTSMSRFSKIFPPTYIALIKAGEKGGVLDSVLARLADNLEKEQEFKSKVKGALVYPAIVIIGMIVVTMVMMIFVIPRLTTLYKDFDVELPATTKFLISLSGFFVKGWPLIILGTLLAVWGLLIFRNSDFGRAKVDALIFRLPVFGELQRKVFMTELTRTLSMMIESGVSILDSLEVTAEVVNNKVIADALLESAKNVERGFPLAFSFAKHPEVFPYILPQMVAVGEETGKTEEILIKVSKIFEMESDQMIKTLITLIEPGVMIFLGIGVAFLMISIMMPIYNLASNF